MNIVLINPWLTDWGGMERIGADMANRMSANGHAVAVFCHGSKGQEPAFRLDEKIHFGVLNLYDFSTRGREKCRHSIEERSPDVIIIMYCDNLLLSLLLALEKITVPVIISEHAAPETIENKYWNRSERLDCMRRADIVHLLTSDFRKSVPSEFQSKTEVIPNFTCSSFKSVDYSRKKKHKRIISVGRLQESEKQYSLLIKAFSILCEEFDDWRIDVWGSGDDFDYYIDLIAQLKLQKHVNLHGFKDDIDDEYLNADIYVSSSKSEGFSLAMLEAMSHGLPLLGFSECFENSELVVDGVNAVLIPEMTFEALAHSMYTLMASHELRKGLGTNALVASKRYRPDKVMAAWESLLNKVTSKE